jgi:hypothetical protein
MKKLFLPILFLAILIPAGAGCVGQTNDDRIVVGGNTPTEMFKAVIADPIPNEVRSLEGYGETSQGHNIYLTFIAPDKFIKKIIGVYGFKEGSCDDKKLSALLTPPAGYVKKMSFWDIQSAVSHAKVMCYQQDTSSNKRSSNATKEFLIDQLVDDTKTTEPFWKVYFHETGI